MICAKSLKVFSNGHHKLLTFGIVNSKEELDETFRLRYNVYSERGYINSDQYQNGMEMDSYDLNRKCQYFIAKCDNKIIGYIRLIKDNILPTEKHFHFEEPKVISSIPRNRRCEFGRFIIIPPNRERHEFLPRGLIMLFLINIISIFAMENDIDGGYSFIKLSLFNKMNKLKMPIGRIDNFEYKIIEDDVLNKYFSQKNDPVIPIFFSSNEYYQYSQQKIDASSMFSTYDNINYTLKNNLYTNFLKLLNII